MRERLYSLLDRARDLVIIGLVLIVLPFALAIELLDPYEDEDEWG